MRAARLLIAPLVALSLGAVACSSSEGSTEPPPATPTQTPEEEPSVDLGGGEAPAGSAVYEYSNGEVAARLTLQGNRGRLRIANRSGRDLGEPGIYALDNTTGKRIGAEVEGAEPLADGRTATFRVSFPEGFGPEQVGLVALLVGTADYGAFLPA